MEDSVSWQRVVYLFGLAAHFFFEDQYSGNFVTTSSNRVACGRPKAAMANPADARHWTGAEANSDRSRSRKRADNEPSHPAANNHPHP